MLVAAAVVPVIGSGVGVSSGACAAAGASAGACAAVVVAVAVVASAVAVVSADHPYHCNMDTSCTNDAFCDDFDGYSPFDFSPASLGGSD